MSLHAITPAPCRECARRTRCLGGVLVEGMPEDRAMALGLARAVLAKGDHLYHVGDRADYVYAVRGGALKTYVVHSDGEEEVRGFQLAEDVAGLDGICGTQFRANARALSRTWVCRLPVPAVRERMLESAAFRDRILLQLGREFDRLHGMLHRERCTADQRVAAFLLTQLEAEPAAATQFELPMSRVDLARYLDLATETVSRVLSRLQARNIVRTDGSLCVVMDRAALGEMA